MPIGSETTTIIANEINAIVMVTDMLVGSIVIEQVFNIPGIGRILLTSISYRDYPVVETIIQGKIRYFIKPPKSVS